MQFYDVFNLQSQRFILRADMPVISMIYKWRREAEQRIARSGPEPTTMHGNGKHEDVIIKPVMDWKEPQL